MQICEYFFENACYSVTKYYLCKQNNKRSLLGRKQQHQVVRSFPNRYLFSLTNKVTSLFPISCILEIILACNLHALMPLKHVNNTANTCFQERKFNVLASINILFVKISPFLQVVCLLIFSISQILDDRFLVK